MVYNDLSVIEYHFLCITISPAGGRSG